MTLSMSEQIRAVLAEYGRLPVDVDTLADGDDLYRAGLTSHASVNVMLGLEDAFDIEFPDELLRKSTFESIDAISTALGTLVEDAQVNV
jgi:acyl carrier protein